MGGLAGTYLIIAIVLTVFLIVLAIVWIMLPFIIMGTNSRMDRLIAEQRRTNEMLDARLPDLHRK